MLDIKWIKENAEYAKKRLATRQKDYSAEIARLLALDSERRALIADTEAKKAEQNRISKTIPQLKKEGKDVAPIFAEMKALSDTVKTDADRIGAIDAEIEGLLLSIPNVPNEKVPVGKDDSENVEVQKYGEPFVPDYEIPYHTDIMETFDGIDMDAAGRVAGNGFYYLMGDIARLHSAVISYARDFMIDRGFTYVVPPFMIRSNVVTGVMSFEEMDAMMYKIEGEDLYLIGTSEHSMIGKFIDTITPEEKLPLTLTS